MNEWVLVEDKLPHCYKYVLVTVEFKIGLRCVDVGFVNAIGEWQCEIFEDTTVIAWMPFPPVYFPESEETTDEQAE